LGNPSHVHTILALADSLIRGIFAADYIAILDGHTRITGGWLNNHWSQVAPQIYVSMAVGAYSYVVTIIVLFITHWIMNVELSNTADIELYGIDAIELGEFAYDYVERE